MKKSLSAERITLAPLSSGVLSASPAPAAMGERPTGDVVLDAAANCVRRKGFDAVSLEEVALEAGVSRTTLYRRFGNREALFKALLVQGAKPFREWSMRISQGPGTVAERLEIVLAHAIMNMQQVGWLDRSLQDGMSAASARLFKAAHADSSVGGIRPILQSLIDERADSAGVTVEILSDWVADQMIALASGPHWDQGMLRSRLRFLVMPVLTPAAERQLSARHEQLEAMDRKLDKLIALTAR